MKTLIVLTVLIGVGLAIGGCAATTQSDTAVTRSEPTATIYGLGAGSVLRGDTVAGPVYKIAVEDNSASMFKKEVATKCRPIRVGNEGISTEISIGDTVRVKGHEIPVRNIMAIRPLKSDIGSCRIYETSLDRPVEGSVCVDGLWIEVNQCRIIEAPKLQLPPGYSK